MKKIKNVGIIIIWVLIVSTIFNCLNIKNVNAEEVININKFVTSSNGTVEYEITGLKIEEGKDYQWGISKKNNEAISEWNDVISPNFDNKSIEISVNSSKYLDLLKTSDTAYIYVKEKDAETKILDGAKVDLSLPLGKAYNIEDINDATVVKYEISGLYGMSARDIQYLWEEITDSDIINSFVDNNHDISNLPLKGKESIPSSTNTAWKSFSSLSYFKDKGKLETSDLPSKNGLYYLWLKNTSTDIKTIYGQIVIEIGEVKKVTDNTSGNENNNNKGESKEETKLDPNNLISYPIFIVGGKRNNYYS